MNRSRFDVIVEAARGRQDALLKTKGDDYTRKETDRLSNFKRVAEALELSPLKVWAVYAAKHWDAIMAFIKTGRVESEGLEGRLDDLCNYLYLLEGLVEDVVGEQTSHDSSGV